MLQTEATGTLHRCCNSTDYRGLAEPSAVSNTSVDEGEQGQRGRRTTEPSMRAEHGRPETGACALGMAPVLSEQLLEPTDQEPQGSAGLSQNTLYWL